MKEIHTHSCTYEHTNENYIGGYKTRYIGLYDDNNSGLFYINFLEEYNQDEIVSMTKSCADEIVNRQLYDVVELMENLIQMSDYQLCKWLSLNVKYFKNCEIKEIGSHSNEEHNFIIGNMELKYHPNIKVMGFLHFYYILGDLNYVNNINTILYLH